ncbi:MAG TPA: LamG-like jellyroll fold domain-containing protein, partial [Acidobacteriaceae bacterium]|nr:LamG-like jellyroll fold domain-containing protein [Acidobacteriaceae bacterium]
MRHFSCLALVSLLFGALHLQPAAAQAGPPPPSNPSWGAVYGPYNGAFLSAGMGLDYPVAPKDPMWRTDLPWSMYAWVQSQDAISLPTLVAGVGDPLEEYSRYFAVIDGKLTFWMGTEDSLSASASLTPGTWHFLAAAFDGGVIHLYADGAEVASGPLTLGSVTPTVKLAPQILPWPQAQHFAGKIAAFTLLPSALDAKGMEEIYRKPLDFSRIEYDQGSKQWPVQTRAQAGLRAPQDPSTLPTGIAPFSAPVAQPVSTAGPSLESTAPGEWVLAKGWQLTEAAKVAADPATLSQPGFAAKEWLQAAVPGTVLTTMVDRGIYPDPGYGLNNLAIPESLNKQQYWYRIEFTAPSAAKGKHLALTFNGINYAAEVWLDGRRLGSVRGAFLRGTFDVTGLVKPGRINALAVLISPPPHPGIPHEQSIKAGPGDNGGIMALDGPTFVATEGWDWIPGVRDRDTGIWQNVMLTATSAIRIGDPQVVTALPLPDTSRADVEITVPLTNLEKKAIRATVKASFEQVTVSKQVTLPPGDSVVQLRPSEFAHLRVAQPRLWWPNGYGKQELYHLTLAVDADGRQSDQKQLRFGIREITYELSLIDSTGHLRRVEVSPTDAKMNGNAAIVDESHDALRQTPEGWVASLARGAESSPAVRPVTDTRPSPYLVIRVNGVRIAARGGNWGMDDAFKRVSRERLEPYFRLHHDANLNIIRNWVGQNTEQVFYDLADEYGLLVWNDFWASTENYNLEPDDPALFLKNAQDTIQRFRNHPSIVAWCARNEGVPSGVINDGLASLVRTLDGTRNYFPSSNQVNLLPSGPYRYQDPAAYFTNLGRGFAVEMGVPSMPTLEAFRAMVPKADRWPVSDTWAYHDWHQQGNGDVAPFMNHLQAEFGAASSLEDFERKAQMLDYVEHRAIFEGFGAHLWAPNSGRLLWMTQPAWPSTVWQIISHDYDTQASFYGVKKACEPVHVQL